MKPRDCSTVLIPAHLRPCSFKRSADSPFFLETVVLLSLAMHGPWWRPCSALTLSILMIQTSDGFFTAEILICPNFFHLLWSFQLLGDTHLYATVQLISCFTGCILQFFSDGSPSDILWQLISKVGHEFKKYVIWAPLTINCLYALFLFGWFLRHFTLQCKYQRMKKRLWTGSFTKQDAVNLMIPSITSLEEAIREYMSLLQHYILQKSRYQGNI